MSELTAMFADADPGQAGPERIAFLLIPNFSMIAFTAAIEPLRLANRTAGRDLYSWTILAPSDAPVRASNGLSVNAESGVQDYQRLHGLDRTFDWLFLCGGLRIETWSPEPIQGFVRRAERQGIKIGALCTASHVLARLGLLDGHKCCVHWENLPGFQETFPDIEVSADLFEVDRNRYTCSGGTAALDMMLFLINQRHGGRLATAVSEQCLLDRIRHPHDRQRLPLRARLGIHNPKLIAAIEVMEANLSEPLSQDAVASHISLSRRQLERLFRKHIGRSPAQYYLELRLERARHLLYQSEMAIVDLAMACGFVSASHFSKCYRDLYGKSPRAERQATLEVVE